MEMSWMQTIDLLGVDVLAILILVLLALQAVEHALHAAWGAFRSRDAATKTTRPRIAVGAARHV